MALLNSSHLIAVLTHNTKRSRWVPYEYGRVKEDEPISRIAASWLHPTLTIRDIPEYLNLGEILRGDMTHNWISANLSRWPRGRDCPHEPWDPASWPPEIHDCPEVPLTP